MKRGIGIVLCLLLWGGSAGAKKVSSVALTAEQEQQMKYYFWAALHAWQEEDYVNAFTMLTFCQTLSPDDAQTNKLLGVLYAALQENELAEQYMARAYAGDEDKHWKPYVITLFRGTDKKKHAVALRIVEKAVAKDPTDADRLELLRNMYWAQDDYKHALKIQEKILETGIEDEAYIYDAYKKRIMLLELSHAKPKRVIEAYANWLELFPDQNEILNNYAYYLAEHDTQLDEADRMSLKTISRESDNPLYLDTFGWIQYKKKNIRMALFYLKHALDRCEKDSELYEQIKSHLLIIQKKIR